MPDRSFGDTARQGEYSSHFDPEYSVNSVLVERPMKSHFRTSLTRLKNDSDRIVNSTGPAPLILDSPLRFAPQARDSAPPRGRELLAQQRPACSKSPGSKDDAIIVMGYGAIAMPSGVDLFISTASALRQLSPSHPFRFVWVGKETEYLYSRYLAAQIDRCGLVETVEFIEEQGPLDRAFRLADIFFLSSRLDSFPEMAVAAMRHSVPVVCFQNASVLPEMLSGGQGLERLVAPYMDAYSAAGIIDLLCTDHSYRAEIRAAVRNLALSLDMNRCCERVPPLARRASPSMGRQVEDPAVGGRGEICAKNGGDNLPAMSYQKYDRAYRVWKGFRKTGARRDEALRLIDDLYGLGPFFMLYPVYKLIKPFIKLKNKLARRPFKSLKTGGRALSRAKKTILLFSHEASLTGAPLIAFNILEKLSLKYNVISVLLGPGRLEKAFESYSVATLGPFSNSERRSSAIHEPILRLCKQFSPSFAVVNSLESREALVPLKKAGVPSILLVHEFASLWEVDMRKIAANASQMIFSSPLVLRDTIDSFPRVATQPIKILNQGPCRIPREWLNGESSHDEETRIASIMRPLGAGDDSIVVLGCGTIEMRKGVDLFIGAASALKQLSPSRRFRFVWVGKQLEPVFTRYLAEQIELCGLQETVKFLGELSGVDLAYELADIFFLSSRLDPFPNVAIEAMSHGLPVVCFENGSGTAEMLSGRRDLKKLVVPYMDVCSAAGQIELLGTNRSYRAAVEAEVRKLAASFDMDRYCEQINSLAEKALIFLGEPVRDSCRVEFMGQD